MTASSYDRAPYSLRAHRVTHPRNLAAAARLLGFAPQDIRQCRVLDLGCAQGGNLIPMAEALPGSEFVGIDYSPRQVEKGQAIVSELDLQNVTLYCEDIAALERLEGRFHYIIVHGVYSWVTQGVRERIMALCKAHLEENGVAYISFNTYPGWYQRRMVREIMQFHVGNAVGDEAGDWAARGVGEAREILAFLAQAVPTARNPYGMVLRQMATDLGGLEDAYILHEYLEDHNEPLYFNEFLAHARRHGLDYLADAQYLMRDFSMLPDAVAQRMKRYCRDELCLEQYLDFIRNESFRHGLLCHEGRAHARRVEFPAMETLFFSALSQPMALPDEPRYRGALGLKNAHGTVIVESNPLAVKALRHLCRLAPRSVGFDELWAACRDESAAHELSESDGRRSLASRLVQAQMAGMVEGAVLPVPLAHELPPYPKVPAFARWQSRAGQEVTSLRHENIGLDEFTRRLLPLLDGSRDYANLLRTARALLPGVEKAELKQRLGSALEFLRRAALLSPAG